MAVLYTPHFVQFLDDDGEPLDSGKLYTYVAGSVDTPKATYTTAAGSTPLANPVVLDASGRAVIFLSGSYKFRLEDSAGNLIRETDNVTAFSIQSATVDDIITNFTEDTVVAGDSFIFSDLSDSNTTKRDTVQGLIDLTNAATAAAFKDRVLTGLILSNNVSDATNDIDVSAGSCVSDDGTTIMTLSAITKRLDASWAVGTNQGGLDTGAIANTTYHVWVIHRTDTSVTDVIFSTSASTPTMPTGYNKQKCIGSIVRASASILGFNQFGNDFYFDSPPAVYDSGATAGISAITATLGCPIGVKFKAYCNMTVVDNANYVYASSLDNSDLAPSTSATPLSSGGVGTGATHTGPISVWTNTNSQIRVRQSVNSAGGFKIATLGWMDTRR